LSRPKILGFTEDKLTTKSIEKGDSNQKHGFMVVIPHHADGIVMFKGADKPLFFAIHRTGEHMRRVASAFNKDGQLVTWSGAEADRDFAEQKAYWAER
jgi:hypothetical protein